MLPPPAPVVVVQHDDGGLLVPFQQRIAGYLRRGTRVRVMGECASACTMVLRLGDRVCAGPGAVFGFHQSYTPLDPQHIRKEDVYRRNEAGTAVMWSTYPSRIRAWLDERGGLTADYVELRGAELRSLIPSCP